MAFDATLDITGSTATITLSGDLDASTASVFKEKVDALVGQPITRLALQMAALNYMASAGLRVLIFAKQKMGSEVDIYIVSPQETVLETLLKTGFNQSVYIVDSEAIVAESA